MAPSVEGYTVGIHVLRGHYNTITKTGPIVPSPLKKLKAHTRGTQEIPWNESFVVVASSRLRCFVPILQATSSLPPILRIQFNIWGLFKTWPAI